MISDLRYKDINRLEGKVSVSQFNANFLTNPLISLCLRSDIISRSTNQCWKIWWKTWWTL